MQSTSPSKPPRKIIGFSGPIGCGKTTAAMHLCNQYGFERYRFAQPLKNMLKAIGLTDDHLEGNLKETPTVLLCGKTPRYAMQTIGTEWGRQMIGSDIWLNIAEHTIRDWGNVVMDDVRFPNEVDLIHKLGGIVARVRRPGYLLGSGHSSEEQKFPCDYYIVNSGTLKELTNQVDNILLSPMFKG